MKINFNKLGIMIDCSRNAVMNIESLKKFITIIQKMGYNQVHLYMEDTYEIGFDKHFGYLRGRYTKEELKELDDFAFNLGVELVPNIQTLAHMTAYTRWCKDIIDADDILLVGTEKVYDLIKDMFASLRECFRTENIHIGMDEAHMLGRGKYFDLFGSKDRFEILLSHLNKVCEIAKSTGFKPMMWSDMFYRIANGGDYYNASSKFDKSIKDSIPADLTLVYWDYYHTDFNTYNRMLKGHKQLSDNVILASGAWKWAGFAPNNYFTLSSLKPAIKACTKNGVKDIFITMWGDNGAECSSFSVLPSLCYAACLIQGITKISDIKQKFKEWVGVSFDDFMLLDLPNKLDIVKTPVNPSKYFLYGDCFMSIFQSQEKPEYKDKYVSFARKLKYASNRTGEYSYLFDTLSKLCNVLAIKQDICSRTRETYKNKELLDGVISDYKKMIKRTEEFYLAFRNQWYKENKPFGFEIQDARLGGLIQRMKSCLNRLIEFKEGEITSIPELEQDILPIEDELFPYNEWKGLVSTSVM